MLTESQQPLFIAEVSSNHNQSLERCLRFVDVAAEIGCDAVKFQLFRVNELFTAEILAQSEKHRARAQWELPLDFLPAIKLRCDKKNILFGCTPFYLRAVDELSPYVDFYKIASYELLWKKLITKAASTLKPIMLSTGMADMDEIEQAVKWVQSTNNNDYLLFHTVSNYPAHPEDCNLSALQTMRAQFDCAVGWSDHTVVPGVIHRAIHHWYASVIEFHLDLDGEGAEYASGHCWLPQDIQPVIQDVRSSFSSDGDGLKQPVASEMFERQWRADPEDGLRPLQSHRGVAFFEVEQEVEA